MARRGRQADPYLSGPSEPIEDPFATVGPTHQAPAGGGDGAIVDPYADAAPVVAVSPGGSHRADTGGRGNGAVDADTVGGAEVDTDAHTADTDEAGGADERADADAALPLLTHTAGPAGPADPPRLTPRGPIDDTNRGTIQAPTGGDTGGNTQATNPASSTNNGDGDDNDEAFIERAIEQARVAALQELQARKAARETGRIKQVEQIRQDFTAETARVQRATAGEIERLVAAASEALTTATEQITKIVDIQNQAAKKLEALAAAADDAATKVLD